MKQGDKINLDFVVTNKTHQGFIDLFNDRNPLHTNNEYAKQKGFKDRVMHGNILNGFLSFFVGECLPTKDVIIHSQQIHFGKPVYLNDKLHFEAIVGEVYDSVNALLFKFIFKNENGERIAKGNIQIGLT